MNLIDWAIVAIVAALAGAGGAVMVDLARDVKRHGLDNHPCDQPGCCR